MEDTSDKMRDDVDGFTVFDLHMQRVFSLEMGIMFSDGGRSVTWNDEGNRRSMK